MSTTSYITYDNNAHILTEGTSSHQSIMPLLIEAGSTSVIHANNTLTGRVNVVIGSYVNNVRHMNEGLDRRNGRDMPEHVNFSAIEDLRYRSNVNVGTLLLPAGSYNIVTVLIISSDDFDAYCERGVNGTSDRICEVRRRVEENRFRCDLERYFFNVSISLFVHIVIVILLIVIILSRSGRL